MNIYLKFVTVMNGHPFFSRLDGNPNEDAGIVVEVAHFVDDADAAVAELSAGPVEEAHAAMRLNEAVFHGHVARSDVFPTGEILAIEERLPRVFLRKCSEREQDRCGS